MAKISLNFDFKPRRERVFRNNSRISHRYWGMLSISLALTSTFMAVISNEAAAIRDPQSTPQLGWSFGQPTPEHTPSATLSRPATEIPDLSRRQVVISPGDTLSQVFMQFAIGSTSLANILDAPEGKRLKRMIPGQVITAHYGSDGLLDSLEYRLNPLELLKIVPLTVAGQYDVSLIARKPEVKVVSTAAVITDSLFASGQRAGLSDGQVMELAKVFKWDIDFAQDIRPDDTFSVVFEQRFVDGERLGDGGILAAEFSTQGKIFQVVRYVDDKGRIDYYRPDGKGLRKAFIRTPVDFSRISSGFGQRYHPVLNRQRAHNGVDYSAPTGTPIKATGNGVVSFVGNKSGYGKTIIIKHQGQYQTLYAHLSKFSRHLRVGSQVSLGQVIGQVGSTGMATGPHLHYEFQVNGVHRNPLTVALPNSEALPRKHKSKFMAESAELMALLKQAETATGIAKADMPDSPKEAQLSQPLLR